MKRILCYGDSNTWGHNPAPEGENYRYRDEERWTGILQELLQGQAKIVEEGMCGRTVLYDDPVASDRNGSKFLNCCLQSHQPLDLVIFMLGTNDTRHIFTPSMKDIALGMENLVKMTQNPGVYSVGRVPELLVIAPAPLREEIAGSEFYGMYDEESVIKSRKLLAAYQEVFTDKQGIHLLDGGAIAEVSVEDCLHLTRMGHRRLAEAIASTVREILEL